MNKIKKSCLFRTISLILIFTFVSLDISYAYPPEHNAGNSTLATPSVLQQQPINGQLGQSLLFKSALVALVCDIGEYSFGNSEKEGIKPLPSKYVDDAMKADLGKHLSDAGTEILNIVPVEYIKKTTPEKFKSALDEIDFKGTLPDEGVVFILCKKGDKKFLLLVARKDQVSSDSLPGHEWQVSDKYVVKYVPEEKIAISAGSGQRMGEKEEKPKDGTKSFPFEDGGKNKARVPLNRKALDDLMRTEKTKSSVDFVEVAENYLKLQDTPSALRAINRELDKIFSMYDGTVSAGIGWEQGNKDLETEREITHESLVELTARCVEIGIRCLASDFLIIVKDMLGRYSNEEWSKIVKSRHLSSFLFMPKTPRVIFFDIDGVLFRQPTNRYDILAKELSYRGINIPANEIEDRGIIGGGFPDSIMRGDVSEEEFISGINSRLRPYALEGIRVNFTLEEFIQLFLMGRKANDKLLSFCKELKGKGVKFGIISDRFTGDPVIVNKMLNAAFPGIFDDSSLIFFSCQEHLTKHEKELFERAKEAAITQPGVEPEQIFFFDDNEQVIKVAESVGIKGLHYVFHDSDAPDPEAHNELFGILLSKSRSFSIKSGTKSFPVVNRKLCTDLNETDLSAFRMKIRDTVKNKEAMPLDELVGMLPQNSALRNALLNLKQIQGQPTDEDTRRIIKENNLNDAEQIAFVLVVQPGQGVGKTDSKINEIASFTELSRAHLITLLGKQEKLHSAFVISGTPAYHTRWKSPTGLIYTGEYNDYKSRLYRNWLVSNGSIRGDQACSTEFQVTDVDDPEDLRSCGWVDVDYTVAGEKIIDERIRNSGDYHFLHLVFKPVDCHLSSDFGNIEIVYIIGLHERLKSLVRIADEKVEYDNEAGKFVHKETKNLRYFVFLSEKELQEAVSRKKIRAGAKTASTTLRSIITEIEEEIQQQAEKLSPELFTLVQSRVPRALESVTTALNELKPLSGQAHLSADAISDAIAQAKKRYKLSHDETKILWLALTGPGQGVGEGVGSQKESDDLAQPEMAQVSKTTQLFEIVESSLNNERAKFINASNELIGSLPAKSGSEAAAVIGTLDKDMATDEIRQRVERAIAAIGSLDKEGVTPETKTAIESLKKNLNQIEADGAVGALIVLARKAKRENQKLIIGLETDWIPGINVKNSLQRQAITALMKEIDSIAEALQSMGLDNVEVIRGSGSQLASTILNEAEKTHTKMHNIVVMASANTINSDGFASLRNADESNRPFLTGIDPTELIKLYTEFGESVSKQLYIKLASLLYMMLELAAGKEPPQSPIIVSYDKKLRILMLLPKADPIDYELLKNSYAAEKVALQAA